MNRVRVPRASMAVTLLDDAEFIGLLQSGHSGRDAAFLFVCLVIAAKKQRNGGVFHQGAAVIAAMAQWPVTPFTRALDYLTQHTNWVVRDQERLVIRSFNKWQSGGWGGPREGSGRPPNDNQLDHQDGNQDETKMDSSCCHSVPSNPNPLLPKAKQSLFPVSIPRATRANGQGKGERALRGGEATDGAKSRVLRAARASQALERFGISKRNISAARNMLNQLADPLGRLTIIEQSAKRQGITGEKLAGYVYKSLVHETENLKA